MKYTRTISPHLISRDFSGLHSQYAIFPDHQSHATGAWLCRRAVSGLNSPGGSIFGLLWQSLSIRRRHGIYPRHALFQLGRGDSRQPRFHDLWHRIPTGPTTSAAARRIRRCAFTSASGKHDIQRGDPLPDSLTGLLTATPYSYNVSAVGRITPVGDKFDEAGVRREAYNFYFQDAWKATPQLTVSYGLRYEVNSRITRRRIARRRPSIIGPDGNHATFWIAGRHAAFARCSATPLRHGLERLGAAPRSRLRLGEHTVLHAGGAIITLLPNLWQDNFVTAAYPSAFSPYITAQPGIPVPFQNSVVPVILPPAYTPEGQLVFPTGGDTQEVPAEHRRSISQRFQNDLAALTPGHQVQLLNIAGHRPEFPQRLYRQLYRGRRSRALAT